jgi:hypothetical protein
VRLPDVYSPVYCTVYSGKWDRHAVRWWLLPVSSSNRHERDRLWCPCPLPVLLFTAAGLYITIIYDPSVGGCTIIIDHAGNHLCDSQGLSSTILFTVNKSKRDLLFVLTDGRHHNFNETSSSRILFQEISRSCQKYWPITNFHSIIISTLFSHS